jgi:hypothetical protein
VGSQQLTSHDAFVAAIEDSTTGIFRAVEQLKAGQLDEALKTNSAAQQKWSSHDAALDKVLYGPQGKPRSRYGSYGRAPSKKLADPEDRLMETAYEAAQSVSGDVIRVAKHYTPGYGEALQRHVGVAVKAADATHDPKIEVPPSLRDTGHPPVSPAQLGPGHVVAPSPNNAPGAIAAHRHPGASSGAPLDLVTHPPVVSGLGEMNGQLDPNPPQGDGRLSPGPPPRKQFDSGQIRAVRYTFELWQAALLVGKVPQARSDLKTCREFAEAEWESLRRRRELAAKGGAGPPSARLPPESRAVTLAEQAYEVLKANPGVTRTRGLMTETKQALQEAQAAWKEEGGDESVTDMVPAVSRRGRRYESREGCRGHYLPTT